MKDRLREYITHDLLGSRNGQIIDEEDDLLGSGLVDSLGMASVVLFIETACEIEIPPEDVTIDHFLSLNAIDAYLKKRGVG
jgi:acyl carrier protein